MRIFNIAVAMTIAAYANAQQVLDLNDPELMETEDFEDEDDAEYDNDDHVDYGDDDDVPEDYEGDEVVGRQLQKRGPCKVRATGPKWGCWFRSNNYQAQTRQKKLEQLRDKIVEGQIEETTPFMWTKFPNFFTQKANTTFCIKSDQLPKNRPKTVHTQGLVAHVEWEVADNDLGYTALFDEGSDTVVMRISETNNLFDDSDGLTPSIGLKFLIDGQESYNIVAMESFVASGDWNFFDPNLTNRLKPFNTDNEAEYIMDQTARKKMVEGNQRPFATSISHIAQMRNDGSTLDNEDVKVPYQIYFKAPDNLKGDLTDEQKFDADGNQIHWIDDVLSRVNEGDVIYEVYAQTEPIFPGEDPEMDDKLEMIANIRLKSPLIMSKWADENLFFQHRPVGKDRKFWLRSWKRLNEDKFFSKKKPENVFGNEVPDTWPKAADEAEEKFIDQSIEWGCPFEWLMPRNWSMP